MLSTFPQLIAQILAIAIGLSSLCLYLIAFLIPALYRKWDLVWAGFSLFYALILWVCAGEFDTLSVSLLTGQGVSAILLGWLGSQTIYCRWVSIPDSQKATIPLLGRNLKKTAQKISADASESNESPVQSEELLPAGDDVDLPKDIQTADGANNHDKDETVLKTVPKSGHQAGKTMQQSVTTKPDLLTRIRNFFQGRKSHGKRYVRSPAPVSESSTELSVKARSQETVATALNTKPVDKTLMPKTKIFGEAVQPDQIHDLKSERNESEPNESEPNESEYSKDLS